MIRVPSLSRFVQHVLALRAIAAVGILVACRCGHSVAAQFIVDPSQSILTLSGDVTGPTGLVVLVPQASGSLSAAYQGALYVDLATANSIHVTGSYLAALSQPGPFQPLGLAADFAARVPNFVSGADGFGAIRNSFQWVTSDPITLDAGGNFAANGVVLRILSNTYDLSAAPLGMVTEDLNLAFGNTAAASASLATVGDQYRLTIPVQATASGFSAGYPFHYGLAGQIVAYRPIEGASNPDVINGGFEARSLGDGTPVDNSITDWVTVSGPQNNFAGTQNPSLDLRPQATEGVNTAFINVLDGTASFYQSAIPAGQLKPHTIYSVKFDLGNRDMTDNGRLPNNDMDPFISVKGFFTLGNDLENFAGHVGNSYELAALSNISEGTFLRDREFVLDTSTLSPAQLALPLNIVFQATSTTSLNRGQVNFDNVRLQIAPEPSTAVLAVLGVLVLGLRVCRRRVTS